jgi:thiol-disulfide isomerase/thioredoxin
MARAAKSISANSWPRRESSLDAHTRFHPGGRRGLLRRAAGHRLARAGAKALDGEVFTNESVKGKVVLLQFWTTWCPYCRKEQDAVEALVHDFTARGLVVLAVNVGESKKKVKQYLADSPRSCKIVLTDDTNLAALYAAKSYPLYVLIDRDGNLASQQDGAAGEGALRDLLARAGLDAE